MLDVMFSPLSGIKFHNSIPKGFEEKDTELSDSGILMTPNSEVMKDFFWRLDNMKDKIAPFGPPQSSFHTEYGWSPMVTLCVQSVRNGLNLAKTYSLISTFLCK